MKLIHIIVLLCLSLLPIKGQKVPRDTSYTTHSAWKKVKKKYPHALPAEVEDAEHVLVLENQAYSRVGRRLLCADVFFPFGTLEQKNPLIVTVHGGGWRSGNKSMLLPLNKRLAAAGYVVASVEYRLSDEAKYPAAVEDLVQAIAYLKRHAEMYAIDTSKVAILGCSAGASLASLVAVGRDGHAAIPYEVDALVNVDGVVDFTAPGESGKMETPEKPSAGTMFFGCTYARCPDLWREASALTHVDAKVPPTLFINSSIPRFHAGRDAFLETHKRHDVYFEVHTFQDAPHSFWLFDPWFEQTCRYITHFLNNNWKMEIRTQ